MARKTYRSKRAALAAANGREVYEVIGGWRISRGSKVRGKRGRALKRRKVKRRKAKRKKTKKRVRSNLGNVYRLKKWAVQFAKGRPVRKVPGGWKICRKPRRKKRGNPNPFVCGYD